MLAIKLIMCPACFDIVALGTKMKECECGECCGVAPIDGAAKIYGNSIPAVIDADGLHPYILNPPETGEGVALDLMLLPEKSRLFDRVETVTRYGVIQGTNRDKAIMFEKRDDAAKFCSGFGGWPFVSIMTIQSDAITKGSIGDIFIDYKESQIVSSSNITINYEEREKWRRILGKEKKK